MTWIEGVRNDMNKLGLYYGDTVSIEDKILTHTTHPSILGLRFWQCCCYCRRKAIPVSKLWFTLMWPSHFSHLHILFDTPSIPKYS